MDLSYFQDLMRDLPKSNSTLHSLPSTIMDATIPGYGIFSQLFFRAFGIDIGLIVSGFLVIFGLFQGGYFIYNCLDGVFFKYFTSAIEIEDDDILYSQVLTWIAEQKMTKISRTLRGVSRIGQVDEGESLDPSIEDVLDDQGIFNFEKWTSSIPPTFEPNFGSDRFSYDGRTFYFVRQKLDSRRSSGISRSAEFDQTMIIRCVGRSAQPIKDLLMQIKSWTLAREKRMTAIFRPGLKDEYSTWKRQAFRPSRPIDTVCLDQKQKAHIIQDINEYLHPATARWYAARGIPYRRGYLFHGPPGVGKTSLSFALAGLFGLGVYVISLSEVTLTESDLGRLFSRLPKRCIVLLEDIDSAGLRRENDHMLNDSTDAIVTSDNDGGSDDGITKISKIKEESAKARAGKSLISLAGLLNIIDGAASHEGRVLIMSTNYPESLDAALIRPGRVDLQVEFTLATHNQIRDIFTRMYTAQADETKYQNTQSVTKNTGESALQQKYEKQSGLIGGNVISFDDKPAQDVLSPAQVLEMAMQFANQLPQDTFSPAEIQGYLLRKKTDPSGAMREASSWRDAMIEAKKKGKKVVSA